MDEAAHAVRGEIVADFDVHVLGAGGAGQAEDGECRECATFHVFPFSILLLSVTVTPPARS
jgi:hypothetical protein